ncbi:preprotein translocase subunit SecG [Sungkyunkwania multivorans]|uniref:Protein-export membrane protein SecG n=1 Tax=Sungkyunkwania multivorans TaxID=1173618 RepID=A0ABW3D3Q5_9FLAO
MSTFTIFLALIIIVSFLLVLVIMVQNPKGGGLSSSFGGSGSQQIGGVQKTGDFLDKSTWVLATLLIVLILLANVTNSSGGNNPESVFSGQETEQTTPAEDTPAPTGNDNQDQE